jgi:hypothetical protein
VSAAQQLEAKKEKGTNQNTEWYCFLAYAVGLVIDHD